MKNKKIGILTFHYSTNFGAVLQCISLYETISKLGYKNVEVINFVPKSYTKFQFLKSLGVNKNIFRSMKNILFDKNISKKIYMKLKYIKIVDKIFKKFRFDNLSLSRKVNEKNIFSILPKYDLIIVGSDQIWNPSQHENLIYFLDFSNFSGTRVSYAACCGINQIDNRNKRKLVKAVSNFNFLSVRNDETRYFIKDLINRDPLVVVDPTLLYNFNNRISLIDKKERYILTYIIGDEISCGHQKVLNCINKKYKNIKVKSIIIPSMKFELFEWSDELCIDINPIEWVQLIANADFIYTDSYHGVLFALKYHIDFLGYFTEKNRSSRFKDLVKRYNIEDKIINDKDSYDLERVLSKSINFIKIDKNIDNHKKISIDYLKNSLV